MPTRRFKALIEWDADDEVWVTYVPDLDWLSTYGDTREEVLEHTREAIMGYMEAAAKECIPLPTPNVPEFVEVEVAEPWLVSPE